MSLGKSNTMNHTEVLAWSSQDPHATLVRMHSRPSFPRSVIAVVCMAAAGGAHAASFDCQAAKTATEKAICGSPKLSALDEKLAAEYSRAVHALSAAGATRLKESQRSWLRFATQVCVPRKRASGTENPADCLATEYAHRIGDLAQAGLRLGPYVFNRIDAYAAARDPHDDGGQYSGFVWQHVAFPQIDAPTSPAAVAWNKAQQKDAPGEVSAPTEADDQAEDDETDYTLGCVGDRFVSVRTDTSEYPHGAAHGTYDHEVGNAVLAPALRKMAATDVFPSGSAWKTKLPPLFWNAWLKDGNDPDVPAEVKEAIEASGANPDAWLLTPAGLQIAFSAYEAGCYACNPGPITVPWAALKPLQVAPELAACKGPPEPVKP